MKLHCPNCNHLIGLLEPNDAQPSGELDEAFREWYRENYWLTAQSAADLYDDFTRATGSTMSKKAFGLALAASGATPRRGAQGVRLWQHA